MRLPELLTTPRHCEALASALLLSAVLRLPAPPTKACLDTLRGILAALLYVLVHEDLPIETLPGVMQEFAVRAARAGGARPADSAVERAVREEILRIVPDLATLIALDLQHPTISERLEGYVAMSADDADADDESEPAAT